MTIRDLIDSLERMTLFADTNKDTKIKAYNADSEDYEDITGFLFIPKDNIVRIQTDDID